MRTNVMKAALARGEIAAGVSLMFASPQLVEIVARLGFNWVLLDCEHGAISVESLEVMTMAAEASGISAVARPRSSSREAILEVLERGVHGIQVPHVNTPEQARAVVEATKFAPEGSRGLAARTRPAGYGIGITLEEYSRLSNDETLICVQLEEEEALENLDDIVEVGGIDVFFLGPSDISQSLGLPGQAEHPDVRGAVDAAIATIVRGGRIAGSAGSAPSWDRYRQQGATYLYTHLPTILAAGAEEFLGASAAA
jgi:4-hydroxy-2-oxoheptanedioate aldolase